jgi:cytochrome c
MCTTLAALLCVMQYAIAQDSNDAAIGKTLYDAKCSACHSVDANRTGPLHRGVVGRPVASVPGFSYSPALKRLGGVWTPERLDLWLQNPQALASGSTMYFTVDDPVQRRQIIAYLSTLLLPSQAGK